MRQLLKDRSLAQTALAAQIFFVGAFELSHARCRGTGFGVGLTTPKPTRNLTKLRTIKRWCLRGMTAGLILQSVPRLSLRRAPPYRRRIPPSCCSAPSGNVIVGDSGWSVELALQMIVKLLQDVPSGLLVLLIFIGNASFC